jgi:hypothetical protein
MNASPCFEAIFNTCTEHTSNIQLTLIMDEFGLPVLSVRTFTHSNQRISEEIRGVVRAHAGGQAH